MLIKHLFLKSFKRPGKGLKQYPIWYPKLYSLFILDAIDDDIDAILKIQRNPKWQTLSVRAEFKKSTMDTVIVKSVSIESFEKKE